MDQSYWKKQEPGKLLFPDIEWSKPEQKSARGNLLIIGGSSHGFAGVGKAWQTANEIGAGKVRVALPDVLKKNLPDSIDGVFLPTNPSGGIGRDSLDTLKASAEWADGVLIVGDLGQNSETSTVLRELLEFIPSDKWITITRDAIDLTMGIGENLLNRPRTNLVMSFSQAQKLFSKVYYPKILTFSMQLSSVIDAVHKFTITYSATLAIARDDCLMVSSGGEIVSQSSISTMKLVDGSIATQAAAYLLWSPNQPLQAIATSWQA